MCRVYVYKSIYVYLYVYMCTYVYMYISVYICIYVCVYVYICMYMYICIYVCICACVCACASSSGEQQRRQQHLGLDKHRRWGPWEPSGGARQQPTGRSGDPEPVFLSWVGTREPPSCLSSLKRGVAPSKRPGLWLCPNSLCVLSRAVAGN